MKLTERKKMILIHIAWILALAVILWPLFTIAKYDYPSADDWSFGKYMYRAMPVYFMRYTRHWHKMCGKPDFPY